MIGGINRSRILETVIDQEAMFISMGFTVDYDNLVLNPHRNDKTPKCSFYWHGNKLLFRDFTEYFGRTTVDCFEVFKFLNNRDPTEQELCKIPKETQTRKIIPYLKDKIDIKVISKEWPLEHYLFNIPEKLLHHEGVFLVDEYWCSTKKDRKMAMNRFNNPIKDLTIAYHLNGKIKLYFPHNPYIKFFGNTTNQEVYGLNTLIKSSNTLCITKSGADFLCLKYILKYDAIGINAEWSVIPDTVIQIIKSFGYESIVILYDNDHTGIINSEKLKLHLVTNGLMNIKCKFLPTQVNNKDCKDLKDLYYINLERLKLITNKLLEKEIKK